MPVLNEARALENLLPALCDNVFGEAEHREIELIVVDGGSSDDTVSIAAQYTRVIEADRGRARQMSTGATQARGEILLFLHADTQLPANAFEQIARARSEGYRWGRFDVCLDGKHWLFRIIERMMNWRSCLTHIATGDQAIFVEANLFRQIGGYPNIALMEDIALSKRLRRRAKMKCLPATVVTSSRRWQQHGIVRTVLTMWLLRLLYALGVSPTRLARMYR